MAELMTLSCPSCGAKVAVTPGTAQYICDYCGNEHILTPSGNAASNRSFKTGLTGLADKARGLIPVPQGLKQTKFEKGLRFTRRWFSLKYIPMALFCVAWDSFLIFWYGIVFATHAPWIMVVFPLIHLAVGISLTYSTLAGFLNRTTMEVTPGEITVWHEPLPWMNEITLKTPDVVQLFSKETISRGKNTTTHTYHLYAILKDGTEKKILTGLDDGGIALYIEQQLESWLKIEDEQVAGELPR